MSSALEVQTFSWISHPYLAWLWIWNILYARWAHQRVIIGSVWSTWWLRAQRKQLSVQPTLDCLSQQMPFPSPLWAFSSLHIRTHTRAGFRTIQDVFLSLLALYIVRWVKEAAKTLPLFFLFSQLHKAVRAGQTGNFIAVRQEKFTMLCFLSVRTYFYMYLCLCKTTSFRLAI